MKNYLNRIKFEYLFASLSSAALASAMCQGFYIDAALADNLLLTFGLMLLLNAVLYLSAYSRKGAVIGILVMLAIAAGGFLYFYFAGIRLNDAEGSETAKYIYYIIIYLVGLIGFLLNRRRFSAALFTAFGAVVTAMLAYLEFDIRFWHIALFLFTNIIVVLYRYYFYSLQQSIARNHSFGKFCLTAAILCMTALTLASGSYMLVIKPLDLPVMDINLITRNMTPEVLHMLGITDIYHLPGHEQGNDNNQNEDNPELPDEKEEQKENEKLPDENKQAYDSENFQEKFAFAINYRIMNNILFAVIIALVVILSALLLIFRHLRLKWLHTTQAETQRNQIGRIYRRLQKGYAKLGCAYKPGETPLEFVERAKSSMPAFSNAENDFTVVTQVFCSTFYGDQPFEKDDYEYCWQYYYFFRECYKREIGKLKFLLNSI